MGMKHSVVLANILMSHMLRQFFDANPMWTPHLPLFKRYLDDIIGWWNGSFDAFQAFVGSLNNWSKDNGFNVQFKVGAFGAPLQFLDLEIFLGSCGSWCSRLFCKSTDIHA